MSDRGSHFSISFPKRSKQEDFRDSFEDGERRCLARLRATGSVEALNHLIEHYRRHRREDLVRRKLDDLIGATTNLEARAIAFVYLGWSHERTGDWETAIDAYRGALSLEPCENWTGYFTHNNLGRCLCKLGRYAEAERHCRLAISTDPARPDAHRNLGGSLYGQGDLPGAARAWVDATRANAADGRSLELLERLIQWRPQLLDRLPRLRVQLEECRRAVALARKMYDAEARWPEDRPESGAGCRVCREAAVTMEAFGGPINDDGRRRAVIICSGCGRQSLATYAKVDLATARAGDRAPAMQAPSPSSRPAARPRVGLLLCDLFWLSMLGLAIARIAGFPGLAGSGPEAGFQVADIWLMGLRASVALGLIAALRPVRAAVRSVWRGIRGWCRARRCQAG